MNSLPPAASQLSFAAEVVRRRAYFLWLERGSPHGDDWQDWFAAEGELAPGLPLATATAENKAPIIRDYPVRPAGDSGHSDPGHRFHATGRSIDGRVHVGAGEAPQRIRGRREGGSLQASRKPRA